MERLGLEGRDIVAGLNPMLSKCRAHVERLLVGFCSVWNPTLASVLYCLLISLLLPTCMHAMLPKNASFHLTESRQLE